MARKMKDSGIEWIGEIPEGWEVVKAKYLFAQRNEKGNSALVPVSYTHLDVYKRQAPGRAELGGNHTDHQHGYGLAAAVTLDLVAVAARNTDCLLYTSFKLTLYYLK